MVYNKKQKGGKVLGRGGYGCAIAPAIMCSDKMDPTDKASKLIDMSRMDKEEKDELQEEYKISQKFKKVDPDNKYFLGGIDKCNISSKSISKSDLKKCGFSTKKEIPLLKRKEIPLLNIVMKKGIDFKKITPKLKDEDLLKSIAHLLNGAKKAVYDLKLLLLDVKYLNILYVNSKEENKIHPVFIDFGPALIAQSKREFNISLRSFDSFYAVWPLEVTLTVYSNFKKSPLDSTRGWEKHFNSKEKMVEVLKSNREIDLKQFGNDIKLYHGFDIKKNKKEMEMIVQQFRNDIRSKYTLMMDKIMVYEIANSFSHLAARNKKLLKVIEPMLYPVYEQRLTIAQSLKRIEKKIGSVKEKDLLIPYKKLNVFQKIHSFMTKPINTGQLGAGPNKQVGGTISNLTKQELLRRIRKYEKKTGKKSKILMSSKKEIMVNFLIKYKPEKKVRFVDKPQIIEIEGRSDKERKERKNTLKKIGKKKKELKQIKSIYYKEIPLSKHYVAIKTHNDTIKSGKLKKREPIKFIKGIDFPEKKRTIYEQTKWKKYKMKYKIYTKKNKVKLNIYDKKDPKKEKKIEREYKFDNKLKYDKYRAEYEAKVELIKYIRKIIKKV